jgi:choline dehydrogenase-like flavoprotein
MVLVIQIGRRIFTRLWNNAAQSPFRSSVHLTKEDMIVDTLGDQQYPVIVVGTGFGSLFFVHRLLQLKPDTQVLMLERGPFRSWEEQLADGRNSMPPPGDTFAGTGKRKLWNFTIGYGGGTNCWYGNTLRLHPNDFRLKSLYGRGQDWPISYDDLEPFYVAAEGIMDVSGPDDLALIGSRGHPYPQPPHKFSAVDKVMKQAQPEMHFALPTARARVANAQRPQCCATFRCDLCPVGAKFTAINGFGHIAEHPNVRVLLEAEVLELERSGTTGISAVRFRHAGREETVRCDLCVLGANAIHSPAILLRSGLEHPLLGRGLNEQLGYAVEVLLDGLQNFDGSTISSGCNYSLYDGPTRSEYGAGFMIFDNRYPFGLRREFGRWRETLAIHITVEEELLDDNRVLIDRNGKIVAHFEKHSPYAELAVDRTLARLPEVLAPLPVEQIIHKGLRKTESHLQGTVRMGASRNDSVIDHAQIHHDIRNLVVVGTSVLPTCPAVAPSLTAAALSLRAADLAFG